MEKIVLLKIIYCSIFTICNFAIFLMYYLFGFTYDIELRKTDKRIYLPQFTNFLFYFKGIKSSKNNRPTKIGGGCEIFALCYFLFNELADFALIYLIKDLVVICRIAIALFFIATIVFIILATKTKRRIKKVNAEQELVEFKEYITPKETIDINNSKVIDEFLVQPHESPKGNLQENSSGNEFNRETTNVSEGMESLNTIKDNPIDDTTTILDLPDIGANLETSDRETIDVVEGMEEFNALKDHPIDDESPIIDIPEMRVIQSESAGRETVNVLEGMEEFNNFRDHPIDDNTPIIDIPDASNLQESDITDRETISVREGMKTINKLKNNLIDDD